MTRRQEGPPVSVPQAQQAGAATVPHRLWSVAKPYVWTARMLTTLISEVEGEKWFRLYDKVFAERNLMAAYQQVAKNKGAAGVDHVTTRQLPENLWQLSDVLKEGTYHPQAIRRVHIPKPGTNETRPLGIPTVRDRIVQGAVVNVIEPIFERDFAEQSYGFRPKRGCKDALRRVEQLLKEGYVHVVDADLTRQVASLLSSSTRHVQSLSDAGLMPRPLHLGHLVRWRRTVVDQWLAAGCPSCRVPQTKRGGRR